MNENVKYYMCTALWDLNKKNYLMFFHEISPILKELLCTRLHCTSEQVWVWFLYAVDLVIFACFNFREFLILGLFMNIRIRNFHFSSVSLSY